MGTDEKVGDYGLWTDVHFNRFVVLNRSVRTMFEKCQVFHKGVSTRVDRGEALHPTGT